MYGMKMHQRSVGCVLLTQLKVTSLNLSTCSGKKSADMHEMILTEDGSITLYVPELNEHYHSVHGAIQEALHIFIHAGFEYFLSTHPEQISSGKPLYILEAGFGTGLNAWLTLLRATELKIPVCYYSIEKYPLPPEEISALNYPALVWATDPQLFHELHHCDWEADKSLTPYFCLHKCRADFRDVNFPAQFDLVYFDAFNPDVQPHLWTSEVFERFYQAMKPDSLLVTYCVKGIVKQALRTVGFSLKRLPGPPGKREMLRAKKSFAG